MPVITLTSEWSLNDYYVGAVKGTIFSKVKNAHVIDISHQVQKFNVAHGAFVLRNSFKHFPKGTVHLVAVKSELTEECRFIAFGHEGHYFVGTDNGLFGLIFDEKPGTIVEIKSTIQDQNLSTFPELEVLTEATCHLANGGNLLELGEEREKLYRQVPLRPAIEENNLNGNVIYIDSYNNAISNISVDLFQSIGRKRPFDIFVQSNHYKVNRINGTYNETANGELLAIFNSLGLLEIAINNGKAAELLNLDTKSNIRVKFYDYQNS